MYQIFKHPNLPQANVNISRTYKLHRSIYMVNLYGKHSSDIYQPFYSMNLFYQIFVLDIR